MKNQEARVRHWQSVLRARSGAGRLGKRAPPRAVGLSTLIIRPAISCRRSHTFGGPRCVLVNACAGAESPLGTNDHRTSKEKGGKNNAPCFGCGPLFRLPVGRRPHMLFGEPRGECLPTVGILGGAILAKENTAPPRGPPRHGIAERESAKTRHRPFVLQRGATVAS